MMVQVLMTVLLAMAMITTVYAFSLISRPMVDSAKSKTSVFTKGAAFHQVRVASQRFKTDKARHQAANIVQKLEVTPSEQWLQLRELTLLDSCLLEEEPDARDEFQEAMMDLREMYEPAAGNA